mmetsp:Transcript_18094/g.32231  ORF Transcript_18094/g.32231 Transcript_18094/m.32231 type:complete len:153 (+) Transcript_18094:347-805(+)
MADEDHFPGAGPGHPLREEYSEEEEDEYGYGEHQRGGQATGYGGGAGSRQEGSPVKHQHTQRGVPGEPSIELLFRCGQSNHVRPRRGEHPEDFLSRVTHMTLTKKRLTCLSKHLKQCTDVQWPALLAYPQSVPRFHTNARAGDGSTKHTVEV